MTREEARDEPQFGRAAVRLAIAAANLRDADDRLVALGRVQRTYQYDDPSEADMTLALDACGEVSMAYLHMRQAEKDYEAERERVRGPAPD